MKKTLLLSGLFICGLSLSVHAIDFGNRLSVGGGLGNVYPYKNEAFKKAYENNQAWNADLKIGIVDDLTMVFSYTHILLYNEATRDELLLRPIVLSFRVHPFHKWALSPYIVIGGGVSFNEFRDASLPANALAMRWNKFGGHAGMGMELFLNQGASFGVQGLYHHMSNLPDESPLRLISVTGTLNIYFGEEQRTREARERMELAQERIAMAEQDAEDMRAEAARLKEEAEALMAQAQVYKKKAKKEQTEKEKAQRLANERLSRMNQAQNDLNKLKKMMARKDINPIKFMSGKAELDPSSFKTLDMVFSIIKKYKDLGLRIEGHTDSYGKESSNLRLSQKRANAVKKYLIYKGVAKKQVQSIGLGESHPIADNKTAHGRAKNRRVEFIFFVP